MTHARKYVFATEFAPDGNIVSDVKRLTKDDIEQESALAYERGKKDATAQAERDAAKALQALAEAATAIVGRLDAETKAMREEAVRVATAAARKIAGAALDQFGLDQTQAAIEAAMDALRHHPRLLVKLSPAFADALRPRLAEMIETHGYGGTILVRDDSNLKSGEVLIDWTDGIISIDPADIAARIDALVDAALAAPTTGAES